MKFTIKKIMFEIAYLAIISISGLIIGYISSQFVIYYLVRNAGIMLNTIFDTQNGYFELN